MIKLSIITVNLNNAIGLRKTIESIISQSFNDYEYLIIDGGSTDGSVNIIKEYADKISYWVSEPDKGIYNAMNKGILQAKGEYLQFLNSGDSLVKESVLNDIFTDLPFCDMVYGNYIKVLQDGKLLFENGPKVSEVTFLRFYIDSINHQSTFIKRDLFDRYGLYDEQLKIVSDWKFFLIAFGLSNSKLIYKNIEVAYYEMSGISKTQSKLLLAERKKVLEELVPLSILSDYRNNYFELIRLSVIKKHIFTIKLNTIFQILLVRFYKILKYFTK